MCTHYDRHQELYEFCWHSVGSSVSGRLCELARPVAGAATLTISHLHDEMKTDPPPLMAAYMRVSAARCSEFRVSDALRRANVSRCAVGRCPRPPWRARPKSASRRSRRRPAAPESESVPAQTLEQSSRRSATAFALPTGPELGCWLCAIVLDCSPLCDRFDCYSVSIDRARSLSGPPAAPPLVQACVQVR